MIIFLQEIRYRKCDKDNLIMVLKLYKNGLYLLITEAGWQGVQKRGLIFKEHFWSLSIL
jgi:hypothetical protein